MTGQKTTYGEKLKDPRWQKKRLEIFQRANFSCECCHDTASTLHIHHKYYVSGREPWNYPNWSLLSLCEQCHHDITEAGKSGNPFGWENILETFLAESPGDHCDAALAKCFQLSCTHLNMPPAQIRRVLGFFLSFPGMIEEAIKKEEEYYSDIADDIESERQQEDAKMQERCDE